MHYVIACFYVLTRILCFQCNALEVDALHYREATRMDIYLRVSTRNGDAGRLMKGRLRTISIR